jgi:hypothetical protein
MNHNQSPALKIKSTLRAGARTGGYSDINHNQSPALKIKSTLRAGLKGRRTA